MNLLKRHKTYSLYGGGADVGELQIYSQFFFFFFFWPKMFFRSIPFHRNPWRLLIPPPQSLFFSIFDFFFGWNSQFFSIFFCFTQNVQLFLHFRTYARPPPNSLFLRRCHPPPQSLFFNIFDETGRLYSVIDCNKIF